MSQTTKWDAVFFDFDGVILDSVNVKTEAFAAMFRSYGAEVESAVVAYHLQHGGVSRVEKFRHYYAHLLHKPMDDGEMQRLCQRFSELVVEKVLASPFIEGVERSLQRLHDQGVPMYVVSGTPDPEIKAIVERKGLGRYFREVHGSPRKKTEIVREITQRKSFLSARCLFIGDALSDYEAARVNNTRFLGIVPEGERSIFPADVGVESAVHVA